MHLKKKKIGAQATYVPLLRSWDDKEVINTQKGRAKGQKKRPKKINKMIVRCRGRKKEIKVPRLNCIGKVQWHDNIYVSTFGLGSINICKMGPHTTIWLVPVACGLYILHTQYQFCPLYVNNVNVWDMTMLHDTCSPNPFYKAIDYSMYNWRGTLFTLSKYSTFEESVVLSPAPSNNNLLIFSPRKTIYYIKVQLFYYFKDHHVTRAQ